MKPLVLCAVAVALAACATPGGSGASPSTAGAPATAGQLAQTVSGQQGQAPSTATSGTASVYNRFASEIPGEFLSGILALAGEKGWTPEQIAAVLRGANGAPQTVTFGNDCDFSSSTGSASSIPAGTGGGFGQTGSGSVVKP